MDTEEKKRLMEYSVKMLERGDRFYDILHYLDRHGADECVKKEIILKLEEHQKSLKKEETPPYPVSITRIVFGTTFFLVTLYLMHLGIIKFPWAMLGYFTAAIALFELVKSVLNLFKR
ncbi:MAG: hypothetical protein LBR10_10200 [Prevotellaceae bacterium]|jgi:hypothetical protein|nr:hypothetical protein [Prevotellaceae bacterium]